MVTSNGFYRMGHLADVMGYSILFGMENLEVHKSDTVMMTGTYTEVIDFLESEYEAFVAIDIYLEFEGLEMDTPEMEELIELVAEEIRNQHGD